jgi:hypothetical protein
MQEEIENKIKGIMGLYNFYKHDMNTVQRIGVLTLWIEQSIEKEEYEVTSTLQKELDRILNGEEEFFEIAPSILNKKVENPPKTGLKWVNYWKVKEFCLFDLSFKPFKFVFLNFGIKWA